MIASGAAFYAVSAELSTIRDSPYKILHGALPTFRNDTESKRYGVEGHGTTTVTQEPADTIPNPKAHRA